MLGFSNLSAASGCYHWNSAFDRWLTNGTATLPNTRDKEKLILLGLKRSRSLFAFILPLLN
jgi:hypothetical protein